MFGVDNLLLDPGHMPSRPSRPSRPRPSLELPQGLELCINPTDPPLEPPEDARWKGAIEVLGELVP